MEDGKSYPTRGGTPQGEVISPLLANIYLNELDWELHKAKIYFVRYADDFLLFAKSEEEIDRAGETAKKILEELGLEMAMNKTKVVDFRNEDFDFLGFHFSHWKEGKEGMEYTITPTRKSLKDFKMKIKKATQRKYTLSREEWVSKVNPIIRGKVNYYSSVHKALKVFRDRGVVTHCNCKRMGQELHAIDGYTRQRMRMCFIHKHPTVRKAMGKRQRWNIEFFVSIGLVPANWYYFNKLYGYTKEQYVERQMLSNKQRHVRYIEKLKKKGIAYYTKKRCEKIALACG